MSMNKNTVNKYSLYGNFKSPMMWKALVTFLDMEMKPGCSAITLFITQSEDLLVPSHYKRLPYRSHFPFFFSVLFSLLLAALAHQFSRNLLDNNSWRSTVDSWPVTGDRWEVSTSVQPVCAVCSARSCHLVSCRCQYGKESLSNCKMALNLSPSFSSSLSKVICHITPPSYYYLLTLILCW